MKGAMHAALLGALLLTGGCGGGGGGGDSTPSSGSLDTTFNGSGKVATSIEASIDRAYAVAVQSDGKIIVVGYATISGFQDFAVVRFNTDGSLDTTFDLDGKVITNMGSTTDEARAIAIQSDGKVVVAGKGPGGGNDDFAIARYNANGSLDTSFSGDGKMTVDFGGSDGAEAVAIQSDGKIVVAGYAGGLFGVARINDANGTLDTSFDSDGKQTTDFNGIALDVGYGIALQSDGKIVVAGKGGNGSNFDIAVVRYTTTGSLDTSFDGDGKLTTAIGSTDDVGEAVALQSDGKIVVAGYYSNGGRYDFAVVRYTTTGSLDTSFDGDGKATTAIGSADDLGYGLALQSDGKIVVAGYSGADFAIARYATDGSLDTSFDGDGKATTDLDSIDIGTAVTLQSDGKIIVAGYSGNGAGDDFAVVRYNP